MSRENKLKKLERRRQRGKSNLTARHQRIDPARLPSELLSLSYKVSFEPLANPPPEQKLMDVFDEDRLEELFDLVHDDPATAVEQLRREREKYPGIPTLAQWLVTALYATGQTNLADLLVEENFSRHPDYLFARLDYFKMLLHRGETEAVERLLDQKLDLKLMYPHRDIFHVTELTAFCAFMIEYSIRKGEVDRAEPYFKILEELKPDSPGTQTYRQLIDNALLLHRITRMGKRIFGARAKPLR